MDFCPIAPFSYLDRLDIAGTSDTHLVLAHLFEKSPQYVQYYRENVGENNNKTLIMDNGQFELYRAGLPPFNPDKLIAMAQGVKATHIVLPDYPGEDNQKTVDAAVKYAPIFRDAGFKTFFVPQGPRGNVDQYVESFRWATENNDIDYIGISILAAPIALDCDVVGGVSNIQTFLARLTLCQILRDEDCEIGVEYQNKKIHFLGMTDGPKEIFWASKMKDAVLVDSWDSSSPVWAGHLGISYDNSSTGLKNGKIHEAVDFDVPINSFTLPRIENNLCDVVNLAIAYDHA